MRRALQLSHFEIYLLAMEEIGADTAAIRAVVARAAREGLAVALAHPAIPIPSRRFMASTQVVIRSGQAHLLAAAFCYGREQLVPTLAWYLDRHIGLDGDQHGPLAEQMVLDLCRVPRAQDQQGIKAVLIDPMNALATEQARRLPTSCSPTPSSTHRYLLVDEHHTYDGAQGTRWPV